MYFLLTFTTFAYLLLFITIILIITSLTFLAFLLWEVITYIISRGVVAEWIVSSYIRDYLVIITKFTFVLGLESLESESSKL